jgi:hypothetical protein
MRIDGWSGQQPGDGDAFEGNGCSAAEELAHGNCQNLRGVEATAGVHFRQSHAAVGRDGNGNPCVSRVVHGVARLGGGEQQPFEHRHGATRLTKRFRRSSLTEEALLPDRQRHDHGRVFVAQQVALDGWHLGVNVRQAARIGPEVDAQNRP